jgi:hypothetical protein
MKFKLILILFLAAFGSYAQTKLIAHKSHSGSTKHFAKAYQKGLFDLPQSNFGLPGKSNIIVLDSVIAINDSVTLLKKRVSTVCYEYGISYQQLTAPDFKAEVDTLINHPVFYKRNSLVVVKGARNAWPILFNNPIDEVIFIGFDD